ncbi:hypothetical protein MKX01_003179 [Papaver californicum]|nr:hypothetical protein MKX01_003179 [Papaver californicum]
MGVLSEPQMEEGRMEGWLYLIRSNRIGLQYSQKRYFILENHHLKRFKSIKKEDPVRSAIIDSCIRVMDNGRESIHRKVFFIFTLYNTSDHNDHLKLGASSSEEAAKWIRSLQEAAMKECVAPRENILDGSKKRWQSFRLNGAKARGRTNSIDWTLCSPTNQDPVDVIAPSPWTIFGCQNGLRLFKETKDIDFYGKNWDDHPAIMAVGVVEGTSEDVFRTLMSLGPSRSEWDFCLSRGSVIEHLDGHNDIVHKQLNSDWLPWGMQKRDLLLRRYWRREDDGTYVILYHSVFHKKCLPQNGYVRACLKSGGYVISPVNQGKQSVVKHMLAIDWKFWKSYVITSSAKSITIHMLGRVAALREFLRAKSGKYSDTSSLQLTRDIGMPLTEKEEIKVEVKNQEENRNSEGGLVEEELEKSSSVAVSLGGLTDVTDEFFDVPEPSDYPMEYGWGSDTSPDMQSQDLRHPKLSSAANFVKKLHDLAVQKKGYMDLHDMVKEDSLTCCYGTTLPKDATCNMPCSWNQADPSTFLIRGPDYLKDHQKIKAKGTSMQMVAADWLRSDKREDNLGSRPGSIVQKYAAQGGQEFFFIVNIQVPGATTYNLVQYYMMTSPVEENPLLMNFINGDDAYRNSRFKLIPYISKGSWIVKQSVGKKACLVGQALEINYFRGKNYLELGVDIGSSTVARGVVSLVLGYLNNLVIEMAFLIQGNTQEELPEVLLGTCRFNHLDALKAVLIGP